MAPRNDEVWCAFVGRVSAAQPAVSLPDKNVFDDVFTARAYVLTCTDAFAVRARYQTDRSTGRGMTRVEQERVKSALARYTRDATKSPQTARETLVREGIYLENGKLAPSYSEETKATA